MQHSAYKDGNCIIAFVDYQADSPGAVVLTRVCGAFSV